MLMSFVPRNFLKLPGALLIILFSIIFSSVMMGQSSSDDIIYLKNGSMIRGTIFEQVPDSYVKIKTLEGKVQKYKFSEISKLSKADASEPEVKAKQIEKPAEPIRAEKSKPVVEERSKPVKNTENIERKSPTTAFLFSFILPGGGQYYNGEYGKGAIMTGAAVAGVVLILAAGYEEEFVANDYYWASYGYWETKATPWLSVGIGLCAVASVWSMIDAPLSAKKINERNGLSYNKHMLQYGTEKYLVGCDLIPTPTGMRLSTTIHF
jgi:hypothetical protein